MYHDSEHCWQVFVNKDSAYDGVFVVGVMSTKIYCRPSCAARPLRKNVQFFADNATAQLAGLRPCKRCVPDDISPDLALCQRVCRYIEAQITTPTLPHIAKAMGYSPFHLHRTFKRIMGLSPFGYAQTVKWLRMHHQMPLHSTVYNAITQAGFGSISSYYHAHVQRNQLQAIRTTTEVSIGTCMYQDFVVVGAFHEKGLFYCGIYIDDAHATFMLQKMFGQTIQDASASHSQILQDLITAQRFALIAPAIAKDIRATAFQHAVWQAIRHIPAGQTRQYHEIARDIGHPNAVRAVANACAQNPLAIITPCHRVVSAGSTIGGYRWGTAIKAQLLIAEREGVYNEVAVDSKEQ